VIGFVDYQAIWGNKTVVKLVVVRSDRQGSD
jgi:hypothetical protein